MRANDFKLGGNMSPKKTKRTNWKLEILVERQRILDEVIENLRADRRLKPKSWHVAYNSAITAVEIMKNEKK